MAVGCVHLHTALNHLSQFVGCWLTYPILPMVPGWLIIIIVLYKGITVACAACLLFRWKSSVYQLIWHEWLYLVCLYFAVSALYRFVFVHYPTVKQNFELFCTFCKQFDSPVPVTFLTGFYVSNVASRWWDQFMSLPFPDQIALKLVAFVPGTVSNPPTQLQGVVKIGLY